MIALWVAAVLTWLLIVGGSVGFGISIWRDQRVLAITSWLAGLIFLLLGVGLVTMPKDDRPCVRYETTYQMVGKVMSPVRYCAERGEVVQ